MRLGGGRRAEGAHRGRGVLGRAGVASLDRTTTEGTLAHRIPRGTTSTGDALLGHNAQTSVHRARHHTGGTQE